MYSILTDNNHCLIHCSMLITRRCPCFYWISKKLNNSFMVYRVEKNSQMGNGVLALYRLLYSVHEHALRGKKYRFTKLSSVWPLCSTLGHVETPLLWWAHSLSSWPHQKYLDCHWTCCCTQTDQTCRRRLFSHSSLHFCKTGLSTLTTGFCKDQTWHLIPGWNSLSQVNISARRSPTECMFDVIWFCVATEWWTLFFSFSTFHFGVLFSKEKKQQF